MLTIAQIKENPQEVIKRLAVKGFDGKEPVERVLAADDVRRKQQLENDTVAAELKKLAASIGSLMKQGKKDEAESAKAKVAELKELQKEIAAKLKAAEAEITEILLSVPNLPYSGVPEGKTAADNVVEKSGGKMPELGSDALPHWDLAK